MTDPAVYTNAIHNNTPGWAGSNDDSTSSQTTWWPCKVDDPKEKEKQPDEQVKYKLLDQLKLGIKPRSFSKSPKQFRHSLCRI